MPAPPRRSWRQPQTHAAAPAPGPSTVLAVVLAAVLATAFAATEAAARAAGGGTTVTAAAVPSAAAALHVADAPDGAVELRAGTAVVARIALATPELRRGTPRFRESTVAGHRIGELRVPVRGHAAEEIWIGDLGARPPRVIWSGLSGPRDVDEEAAIFVEVTPERIFEYQTGAQIIRCDGEPVRLFPRAWDFGSNRFRPILSTPPPPAAQRLTARRGDPAMPAGRPIGGFHFVAASTTAAAGTDARGLGAPTALDDGDPKTVWTEGLGGDGRGEFLTARAGAGRYRVRGLRIVPGDGSTPAAWKARNRIKTLALALGPEPENRFEIDFAEDPAAPGTAYWIPLPAPVETTCVTVVIRDVFHGTEAATGHGGGTTAISDLEVFTELDDASGAARLIADVAGGVDCQARVPLVAALGDAAVLPAAQAILVASGAATDAAAPTSAAPAAPGASGAGRECLITALAAIDATSRSEVALDALAAAVTRATPNEERLITGVLKAAAHPPAGRLAAMLSAARTDPEDRARAARVLGELAGADATEALIAATGTGTVEARAEIARALGRSPGATPALVVAALEAARPNDDAAAARQGDLVRALPALVRRFPGDMPAVRATLARIIGPGFRFEVRARAIMAMGAIGDPDVVTDLGATATNDAEDAVLRFLATRELAGIKSPAAVTTLRRALGDEDPRVRETAAVGLGAARDAASEAALIAGAKQEDWPFVRRAEIEALADLCGAAGRDLLVRAVERDVDPVRRAALAGLARCHDDRSRAILIATVKARPASAPLRELAASLLGETGDRAVAKDLAAILKTLVVEAEGDLAIEGVAVAALRGLGQLGGPDAAAIAAQLARDARHPYRHIAIEVLGQICDPGVGDAALGAARAGGDAELGAAAQSAEARCRTASAIPGSTHVRR